MQSASTPNRAVEGPAGPPVARAIASCAEWSVAEFTCRAGPRDRPFEEHFEQVTIAAVVEGVFNYRADTGKALLHPGSLLLGNPGTCFECGHDHSTGDRCVSFQFAPEFFAEIAATAAGSSRYRFERAMLPAAMRLTPLVAAAESMGAEGVPLQIEEAVPQLAEDILTALSGHQPASAAVSGRDARRMSHVLNHIEENAGEPLDLHGLASMAAMSKYHFLRSFRRVVGISPYQFLLTVRMRRAAVGLRTTAQPVSAVAFDAGFGDLSTFNKRFRELFGLSPSAFRRAGA